MQQIDAKRQQLLQQYEASSVQLESVKADKAAIQGALQILDWVRVNIIEPGLPPTEEEDKGFHLAEAK